MPLRRNLAGAISRSEEEACCEVREDVDCLFTGRKDRMHTSNGWEESLRYL